MQQIRADVWSELISPGCNVGIVTTSKGTLICDTPLLQRHAQRIRANLEASGKRPVRFIHYTDHHHDHIMGGGLFGDDVVILAHKCARASQVKADPQIVANWVRSWRWENPSDPGEILGERAPLPNLTFEGELELFLGEVNLVIMPLPGHLPETWASSCRRRRCSFPAMPSSTRTIPTWVMRTWTSGGGRWKRSCLST